jgi:alpha-beta hydrolase superfamily lysophospholipase
MQHSTAALRSADDVSLYGEVWQPDGQARAAVCLVHGLGEHIGRWGHVGAFLAERGYGVVGFDLRGHGKSGGKRGHAPSYDGVMDDIALALGKTGAVFPGRPIVLYGHSLGGNLAINYVLRRRTALDGVVASAPLLRPGVAPAAWKVTMGKLMYTVAPGFMMANGLDRANLSQDASVVRAYASDPLVHDRVSARFALDFLRAGEWALENASSLTLPMLLVQGGKDHLVSVVDNRAFAHKAGPLCSLKEWDGLCHEIHNEPSKDEVLGHLASWLDAACTACPA